MATPKIGRMDTFAPKIAEVEAVSSTPGTAAREDGDTVMGMDIQDLTILDINLTSAPQPPACIAKRLTKEDKMWRWMSRPQVKYMGLRNYVTVSPSDSERAKIDSGEDQPAGVFVDEQNRVCWREDMWLAAIPRRLYDLRRAQKLLRTKQQTKASKDREGLKEAFARYGGHLDYLNIEEQSKAEILREPESRDN